MTDQLSALKKLFFFNRMNGWIGNYLSLDITVKLMVSLVLPKPEYDNAVLPGSVLGQLYYFQRVLKPRS